MKEDLIIMSSRNQNFKSYGRGKHSNHPGTVVNSSIQFDKFFFNNSNKPTASKSAGTIGKWGMTSFTSLRSSSFTVGTKDTSRFSSLGKKRTQASTEPAQTKRPVLNNNVKQENSSLLSNRKFFKSRNSTEDPNQKSYKSSNTAETRKAAKLKAADENKKQKTCNYESAKPIVPVLAYEKPVKQTIKKVAAVKIPEELIENPDSEDGRDKPPIVLRIFKGTSQFVSETSRSDSSDIEGESDDLLPTANQIPNILPEQQQENIIPSPIPIPAPEPKISTRGLKRRSPEQIDSTADSIALAPAPLKTRRAVEKFKSPSPEPTTKTRAVKRRSPEKSRSPEPEPAITTRSLRRRQPLPPAEPPVVAEPQTSPKRTLRSTKNTAPAPAVVPTCAPGKIVITNLNSNNPCVYLSDDSAPPSAGLIPEPQPSPPRKELKEQRSYSNKHKHKAKAEKSEVAPAPAPAPVIIEDPKVEEFLAKIESPDPTPTIFANQLVQPSKVPDTSLDEDRAELLQLLEDDDDDETTEKQAEPKVDKMDEVKQENDSKNSSETQLKIKIKIPKPPVQEQPVEIPAPIANPSCDPEELKSESALTTASTDSQTTNDSEKMTEDTVAKDSEEKLEEMMSSSEIMTSSASTSVASVGSKKGSFFKHRGSSDGNKKRLALYKHKWVDDKDGANHAEEDKNQNSGLKAKTLDMMLDMELDDMPLTKFVRQPAAENFDFDESPPVTGIKCSKKNKDYYTVVRNVKKAHQIQESGEFQEFNDDVEYILDALQDNNPIGTRCLSAITLATKCTEPAFRMHVRAHGTVTKFFRALHDATKDQSLGLCTATVMFVLSQDRLNMDLDRDSLELMLNLLESDASHTKALEDCGLTDSQLTKTRDKVRQICDDIKTQGHAKDLDLDNITVGHLSMETLLSLTSKRAGEWFKEELRELGGLEHIIKTVVECCKHVDDTANAWSSTSLEKIRKVDRCLRVLENVTMLNEENNDYLLEYQDGILIDTLVRMFKVCDYEIPLYPTYSIIDKESTGAVLRECLIANLKVLINVTHNYQSKSRGSKIIGSRPGVIESSLHVLLQVPQYIPKEETFEVMLLTLIMLINLVEHCESNRKAIIDAKAPSDDESIFETKAREPAVKALVSMFYNFEELARNEEKKTDAILEGENAVKPPTNAPQKAHEDFIEETISQLVQKAGQNMEHTLIAAYVAMLIGYLIIDNEDYEKFVRNNLPEKNFQFMTSVLQKFYSFMTLTASGGTASNRDMKSIQMVIKKLQESDQRHGIDTQIPKVVTSEDGVNADENKFNESYNVSDVSISAS